MNTDHPRPEGFVFQPVDQIAAVACSKRVRNVTQPQKRPLALHTHTHTHTKYLSTGTMPQTLGCVHTHAHTHTSNISLDDGKALSLPLI